MTLWVGKSYVNNTYKLCRTIALYIVTVALLRDVVLSQGDVYESFTPWKAVGGCQHVSAVDQGASTVVLDPPVELLYRVSKED